MIFEDINDRGLRVTLKWMPSHTALDEQNIETGKGGKGKGKHKKKDIELPNWCTKIHIEGNKQADRLAGIAARYAQLQII